MFGVDQWIVHFSDGTTLLFVLGAGLAVAAHVWTA